MMPETIILASGSPRRQELLRQIGIDPVVCKSQVEEVVTSAVPSQVVLELSEQKARDVAVNSPIGTVVVGADTVVAADGLILGKPSDHQEACQMIRRIQGRSHQVYTGVTLIAVREEGMEIRSFYEETDVHVFAMTEEEILSYAASEEPMDKAGAYAIQDRFAAYIKGIDGDYSNVVGLPVGRVYQELKALCKGQEEKKHD